MITEFLPLTQSEFAYYGDPSQEELLQMLPPFLEVTLAGEEGVQQIPVTWVFAEDYDQTAFYFYSACPVWEETYQLAEDLDPLMDVPWITMYWQPEEDAVVQGEAQPEMPSDQVEDLPEALPVVDKNLEMPEVTNPEDNPSEDIDTGAPEDRAGVTSRQQGAALLASFFGEASYAATVSNADKIYTYLTKTMGLNMAAAVGVMTNLYAESGMQPNNLENKYNSLYGLSDSEYTSRVNKGIKNKGKYTSGFGKTRYFTTDYSGYGICQWTTQGRRTNLLKLAVKKDVSIADLTMQLEFLKQELEDSYPQVWATLQNVPNNAAGAYLAASHFCAAFEIPANTTATAASRAKTALTTYWKTYSGKAASVSGSSYLGICGYAYPQSLVKGKGMTCSGHVISNYSISSVTAKILNSSGKAVYSTTKKPAATIYSLYNFDSSMLFSKLSAGTYTYTITAKDSSGKSVTAKHGFTVVGSGSNKILRSLAAADVSTIAPAVPAADPKATQPEPASTLKGSGLNYPKSLKKGKTFSIKGKVKSNYNLKKVVVSVQTTKGVKKLSATAKLTGVKSYSVKKLDKKLKFGKLKKGTYYYIVQATDSKKSKQILKKKFKVK